MKNRFSILILFLCLQNPNNSDNSYRDQQSVCLESSAGSVRLPPKPSTPNIHLSDLKPVQETVHGFYLYSSKRKPSYDQSYLQQPLKLRGENSE